MTQETILQQIPAMTIHELYALYVSTFQKEFEHDENLKKEYLRVRYGEQSEITEIDIHDIIDEEKQTPTTYQKAITVHPDKQIVLFLGKTIPIHHYRTEKEIRHSILMSALLEYYSESTSFETSLN